MALWRYRGRVEAAVLGELDGAAELVLFAHLRGCAACRAHYDALASAAQALSPELAQRRERARLQAALPGAPAPRAPATRPRWLWAGGLAALAAALLLWVRPAPPSVDDEVVLRGGEVAAALPGASLLLYAREGGGPVRLAADFPLSGAVKLSRGQVVQLFVRHPHPQAQVVVRATAGDGSVMQLAQAQVGPAVERSMAVGAAFPLAQLAAGSWRLEATLTAPADAGAWAAIQVAGVLEVLP